MTSSCPSARSSENTKKHMKKIKNTSNVYTVQSAHAQVRPTKAQHALVPALPLRHLALHSARSASGDAETSGGASQGRRGEMEGERGRVEKGGGGGGVRRRPESARVFGERGSKWHWTDGGTNKFSLRLSPYSAGMYRCVCVCVCVCMGREGTRAMTTTVLSSRVFDFWCG